MKNWLRPKNVARVLVILGLVVIVGCAPTGAQPRGWSGPVLSDGAVFVATMEGKLATIDIASRSRARADIPIEGVRQAAGFGCAPAPLPVAIYGTPAIAGNVAYIGGYDGRLHAISLAPDNPGTWRYPAGEATLQPIVGGAVVSDGVAYFGNSDGSLYAVNIVGQDLRWKFPTGDKIWSTPLIDTGVIYIGSFDRKLYAVNASDGAKRWEFVTEGALTATPLVYNNVIYVGSFDRHVYAVNRDGTLKWKSATQAEKWFWTAPVVANNTVYAASLDGKVYGFSADNGRQVAVFDLKSPVSSAPVVVDDTVVVVSQDGKVYSINSRNNQMRSLLTIDEVSAPLVASQGVVYAHSIRNEALYAINPQTGVKLWSILLGSK